MSSSSFTGGGVSDLFTVQDGFTGRSMPQTQAETMVAASMNNLKTRNSNHMGLYRQQHQQQQQLLQQQQHNHLPSLFLDPSSHIPPQTRPTLMGKRNLMELHTHHNNPMSSNLILRSVKPRTFQQGSPLSPLSPMDLSMSPKLPHPASSVFTAPSSQRFNNVPLVQQPLHSNQVHFPNGSTLSLPMSNNAMNTATFLANTDGGFASKNTDVGPVQNRGVPLPQESEKKIIDNRLLELEKSLLEDDNDDEGDGVSVVTNSEWSDAIQNLITPGTTQNQKLLSTSPTSSTTSSCSSSSSVASPASICSKQTLMEAASAIYEGKSEIALEILTRLTQISKACGNSEHRLTDHMVSALKSRVNPVENPPQIAELFSREHAESTQLLYDVSPCFKLGFMTANLAILEATLDDKAAETKFHVIDFDIGLGNQYVNLLHTLSAQQNGKPTSVKITTVTDNGGQDKLQSVGDMLRRRAERVNVHFEFNVVSPSLVELSRESLGCNPDEAIAVNFAFKLYRMPDESVSIDNPRDELLRRVKSLAPKVVTVVEQELNTNTAPFMARVSESCSYYGALFDSLESTVSRDNSDRVKVEEGLTRKLSNSISCEGRDRVERCEVFGKWRARMGMAGFQLKQMSQNVAELMWAGLNSGNRVNPGFTVKEENGGICFGWMGRTLTVASAWL